MCSMGERPSGKSVAIEPRSIGNVEIVGSLYPIDAERLPPPLKVRGPFEKAVRSCRADVGDDLNLAGEVHSLET